MELLKAARRRSLFSETVYVVLNILLAVVSLILVIAISSPWPAIALVLLSKWRVFAVRSRYWMANIRANLVDVIVGVSVAIFLYAASGSLESQIGLTVLYAIWLLFIKPRSKRSYVALQSGIAILFGIGAVMQVGYSWPVSVVVILTWLIAYSATRHLLSVEHEPHVNFLSLLWAFVIAEITWLTYHWTVGYDMPGEIQLAENTIIITLLSFMAERIYISYRRHESVRATDIILPVLFALSVIAVILFAFPIVFGRTTQL